MWLTNKLLIIGNSHISSSTEVNNLGTWFDKDLSMSPYVTKVASSCYYSLYNIRHIRKYLSRKVCEKLITALITSRRDYCNSLLYDHPSRNLKRFHSAARLIHLSPRFSPSLPLLYNLHWLPIKYRTIFKILLITYKAIHSLASTYITDLVKVKNNHKECSDPLFLSLLNTLPSNHRRISMIEHSLSQLQVNGFGSSSM